MVAGVTGAVPALDPRGLALLVLVLGGSNAFLLRKLKTP